MSKVRQLGIGAIPVIGLGVYKSAPGDECYKSILSALVSGYRHIDTAQIYNNEADVGRAIVDSLIPREEIFITSKLWLSDWGFEAAKNSVKESLLRLQTTYIDLFLLHAPGAPELRADTWRALENLHKEGVLRDIGVSNFGIDHIEKLLQTAIIKPAVNQIELHPWLQRRQIVQYCQHQGIVLEAYSPLAKASRLDEPVVLEICARLGATAAQVLIAWSLQKGFVTLPKSVNETRIQQNLQGLSVTLDEQSMSVLDSLDENFVTGWDPITQAPV